MTPPIAIPIEINTFIAILTSLEFITSFVTILGISSLQNFYSLHVLKRKGILRLEKGIIRRHKIAKYVGLGFGFSLALSVAAVEYNLEQGFMVSSRATEEKNCIYINSPISITHFAQTRIPYVADIDHWMKHVVRDVMCEKGISTLGTRFDLDKNGFVRHMVAPTCKNNQVADVQMHRKASVDLDILSVQGHYSLNVSNPGSFFEIFMQSEDEVLEFGDGNYAATSVPGEAKSDIIPDPCVGKNISYQSYMHFGEVWKARNNIDSEEMSRAIFRLICSRHTQKVEPIQKKDLKLSKISPKDISVEQLLDSAKSSATPTFSTNISDVSVFSLKQGAGNGSYVCTNSTIRLSYTFLPSHAITKDMSTDDDPVLFPYKMEVLNGTCESTLHVVGRSALFNAVQAGWEKNDLIDLKLHLRYQALLMHLSPQLLSGDDPLERTAPSEGKCSLHSVRRATLVKIDVAFCLFICGLMLAAVTLFSVIFVRWKYWAYSWNVCSIEWAFQVLMEKGRGNLGAPRGVERTSSSISERFGGLAWGEEETFELKFEYDS